MDQLSAMTAVTSFIDDDPLSSNNQVHQSLIVISQDPSPEVQRKAPRPRPRSKAHLESSSSKNSSTDEEEDDNLKDQVTDYLEKLSVHTSSENQAEDLDQQAGSSQASQISQTSPRSSQQSDSDAAVSPILSTTRLANVNEQDTISDESGYSEESSPSNGKDLPEEIEDSDYGDLTVKGVLISDFSPSERLKYLQRSQSTSSRTRSHIIHTHLSSEQHLQATKIDPVVAAEKAQTPTADFFQNKVPEFCINI